MQPELQTRCRVGRGLGRCRSRAWMVGGRWASSARMVPPVVPQGLRRLCSEFVRGSAQSLSPVPMRESSYGASWAPAASLSSAVVPGSQPLC